MQSSEHSGAGLNPYESPASAGGYFADEVAGVCVWQDGNFFVMHVRSSLPPYCISTGQPATRFYPVNLKWFYPIDWSTRRLHVQMPFCDA